MVCTEVSKFGSIWNFIAEKLQVKDTEALASRRWWEWPKRHSAKFCLLLNNYKLFYNLPFQFEPVFGKTAD